MRRSRQPREILEVAAELPRDHEIEPFFLPDVTIGWLTDALATGLLPALQDYSEGDELHHTLLLSLGTTTVDWVDPAACEVVSGATELTLERGARIATRAAPATVSLRRNGVVSRPVTITAAPFVFEGREVLAGPMDLVIAPRDDDATIPVCVSRV